MNHFTLVALLLTACGESWTWDATSVSKDSGGETAAPEHDLDGDGFIDTAFGGDDCWDDPSAIPAGFEAISGTAQPTAAEVHPDATETWYNGVDQDCAGDDDFDQDLDTHRSATHADGTGVTGDDCYDAMDDAYPSGAASCAREGDLAPVDVYPGATDTAYDGTDADCSGNDDFDQDGDTYGRCDECDDTNASIYPNDAPDVWYDGVDANCDGNDGDQDGDGYYIEGYAFTIPADFEAGDCVDTEASTHPNAADAWYDGTDADCLGNDDFDQDADGYPLSDDCDDTDGTIYAGAPDVWYDGVDSDCAGNDDFDQDSDGYSTDDCDDRDALVNPAAVEDCSTVADDDCDGDDNDLDAVACVVWYEDADGDSYGAAEACLCTATTTYAIATGDDCDDDDSAVNPGAGEVCNNGVDDDCDGGAGACGPSSASLSSAMEYTGESAADKAGFSVAGGGDTNGDGFDDVVVGAHGNSTGGSGSGAAYVILGSAAPASTSLGAAVRYAGETAGDQAGYAVSGVGDVDGDGLDDILVGAFARNSAAGAVYLVLGSGAPATGSLGTAIRYDGEAALDYAGISVAGAGDANADGFDDVLIGAPYVSNGTDRGGAAYMVFGSPTPSSMSLAGAVQYTSDRNSDAGRSVAAGGDVDGDGCDDQLVGADLHDGGGSGAGGAYLIVGGSTAASASLSAAVTYTGEASLDYAGLAVAGAGDVDGDGYADILVGAFGNDDGGAEAGAAYLILGAASPASASLSSAVQYTGENGGDNAGVSLSRAGDVDGDGHGDFLIGADDNIDAGTAAGAAYLLLGSTAPAAADLSTAVEYTGEAAGDGAGRSVAGAGDHNADGYADIVVGARYSDDAFTDAGAAYLVLGTGL
ncbi:hypothetical protein LBMAG42_54460 [Deltaproteobacteria bacterium]|nr:hypothetical protein LBMAG42_54460 [Deltaproteobacteria bacterium]